MNLPVTRFADTERGAIAFQVVGEGPVTILVQKAPSLPVDMMWEEPSLARLVTGLASFSRSIWFDPLGSGSSDPLEEIENRLGEGVAADMEGVLDALGCERVVVLDLAMAFPSILFSATHPERTQALVLHNPMARLRRGLDYPEGVSEEFVDGLVERSRLGEWAGMYLSPALAGND